MLHPLPELAPLSQSPATNPTPQSLKLQSTKSGDCLRTSNSTKSSQVRSHPWNGTLNQRHKSSHSPLWLTPTVPNGKFSSLRSQTCATQSAIKSSHLSPPTRWLPSKSCSSSALWRRRSTLSWSGRLIIQTTLMRALCKIRTLRSWNSSRLCTLNSQDELLFIC